MQATDLFTSTLSEPAPFAEAATFRRRPGVVAVLGGLAVALYAVSFFLPAFHREPGLGAFLCALLFVIGLPMWLANPVFWFGLVRLYQGRYRSARKAEVVALLLALSESWMFIDGLGIGYLVWVGSIVVLAAAGSCGAKEEENRRWPWPVLPRWQTPGEAARIASRFRW